MGRPDPLDDLQALAEDLRRRQRYRSAGRGVLVLAHAAAVALCVELVATDPPRALGDVVLGPLAVLHALTLVYLATERMRS